MQPVSAATIWQNKVATPDFVPAFGRADAALYAAKQTGRHRVVVDSAHFAAAPAHEPATA